MCLNDSNACLDVSLALYTDPKLAWKDAGNHKSITSQQSNQPCPRLSHIVLGHDAVMQVDDTSSTSIDRNIALCLHCLSPVSSTMLTAVSFLSQQDCLQPDLHHCPSAWVLESQ
ncbi:hypothetical protein ABBQ32_005049 [Trebouxia sp. C0010 RCD-2024]